MAGVTRSRDGEPDSRTRSEATSSTAQALEEAIADQTSRLAVRSLAGLYLNMRVPLAEGEIRHVR